ncbi:NifU family protein [Micromonospora sp. FIMYZ51]|uniref:NifU family protein n=1 Tax=Micromonospora sp. FIMYZ51 TaxID=3051832 RepID=UPI00311EF8B2
MSDAPAVRETSESKLRSTVLAQLDSKIRPLLRLHGGDCELVGIDGGTVQIRFLMACSACKLRSLTLLAAVRPRLLAIDGVTDIKAIGVGVSAAATRRADAALLGRSPRALHVLDQ